MIKDIKEKCNIQEPLLYHGYFFSLFPFIELSCPGLNFKTIQGILLQLHKMIKDIESAVYKNHDYTLLIF